MFDVNLNSGRLQVLPNTEESVYRDCVSANAQVN